MAYYQTPTGLMTGIGGYTATPKGSKEISSQEYARLLIQMQQSGGGGGGERPASSAPSGVSPSAEEQRYLDQSLAGIDRLGMGQRASINQQYTDALGNMTGDLASRGLDASTLRMSGQLGIERAKNQANLSLEDMLLGQKQNIFQYGAGLTQQGLERGNRLDLQGMQNENSLQLQRMQSSSEMMRALLGRQRGIQSVQDNRTFIQNPNLQREATNFGQAGFSSTGTPGFSQVPGYLLNPFAGR